MQDVRLVPFASQRAEDAVTVRLCHPSQEETCPITMQSMATEPSVLAGGFQCAQLLHCGHRFAAMPLLTYFALHEMRCPLCRGGPQGVRMSPLDSLAPYVPGGGTNAWLLSLHEQATARQDSGGEEEEEDDDDEEELQQHQRLHRLLETMQTVAEWTPLRVVFSMFDTPQPDARPRSSFGCPLQCAPFQLASDLLQMRPRYLLPPDALRSISGFLRRSDAFIRVSVGVVGGPIVDHSAMVPLPRMPTRVLLASHHLSLVPITPPPPLEQQQQGFPRFASFVYLPDERVWGRILPTALH